MQTKFPLLALREDLDTRQVMTIVLKFTNHCRCKREAQELFAAGEDKWGTDEETFIRIFAMRNYYELRMIWSQYVKVRS